MFANSQLYSTERWMVLFVFDSSLRYVLLGIYFWLFDNSFAKPLESVDLILTGLEALGMGTSIFLINDIFILALVIKVVAALELPKFLICVTLFIHYALSFNSLAKLCLAIFLLSLSSVSGAFKCWYGYHIISPPREPILSHLRANDTTIHMDSYNESQGPLSLAYRCQKEEGQEWNHRWVPEDRASCSEGDHLLQQASASSHSLPFPPKAPSRVAKNATPTALSSLQSNSLQERVHFTGEQVGRELEALDHNTAPSVQLRFQTYPYFHIRTRFFQGGPLDIIARLAIILTTLELILAIPSILIASDVGTFYTRLLPP
ncbi:hypothetical protein G7Y89_g5136 [Cudoniella acicularis]|uniref:Uncharacterized protein n=1 Tax=Cudoniella acicularis TaxID=354080 RepID=A0A8H4W6R9_9HELO|nr:hypothetical protein G7Y89_g5136 [Cudoniella acicularis]